MKVKPTSILIPPELKEKARQAAELDNRSLSNWVIQAIQDKLAHESYRDSITKG